MLLHILPVVCMSYSDNLDRCIKIVIGNLITKIRNIYL